MTILSIFEDLKTQTNDQLGLYLFCCSITVIWIVFVLFFNSRVAGSLATFFINLYLKRYSKTIWIRIRSISISFLSGKIMFRGIHYVTVDYTLYIQDGWITFAYWKPQFVKEKSSKNKNDPKLISKQDNLKRTARLNIFLCNFQLHYYNSFKTNLVDVKQTDTNQENNTRTSNSFFNAGQFLRNFSTTSIYNFLSGNSNTETQNQTASSNTNNNSKVNLVNNNANQNDYNFTEDLMQLFSVVNIRIQKGRIFAGNSTLPSTLTIRFSNAKMELVTEKSQSKVDDYCFILKGDLNKLEISLILNKKFQSMENYQTMLEKKLENRILIFKSTSSDFIYVQDVPSILTLDRRLIQKNEIGELIQNEKEPEWSLKLNCNKQTILNYGPMYDRHREALWKFFFPATYETLEPQPEPTLNERRQTSKFDFEIVLKDPNTEVNLIFSSSALVGNTNLENLVSSNLKDYSEYQKKFVTMERKLTLKCRNESFLKMSIPWLTKQYGYKTKIFGEFNSIHSNTNLAFGEFLMGQKLKLDVDINYPLVWNDLQTWNINLDLYRGSTYFVFYHKNFFQELIYDWSSRVMGDMRHFVPYIYKIKFKSNDLEAILPCNQHNWIDTNILENNSFFAVLAKEAYVGLDISFEDFHPEKTNVKLDVKIFDACARFIVPPTNPHLALLKILKKNLKFIPFNGDEKLTFESSHWSQFDSGNYELNFDLANTGKGSGKSKKNFNQSKSKNSKSDLKQDAKNVRFVDSNKNHMHENWIECWQAKNASVILNFEYHPCPLLDWNNKNLPSVNYYKSFNSPNFDCEIFNPDTIFLEIEIGPSVVMLYGTFLKRLWYIKEAYFSWDQFFSEMAKNLDQLATKVDPSVEDPLVSKKYYDMPFTMLSCNHKDPRNFRPLSVKLSLAIHHINGHLALDTTEGVGKTPFPIGFTKLLALELDKKYSETKLQLYVEPVNIFIEDLVERKYDKNLHQGHLCLSNVQVRGHAMFSDENRLKTDTLEYAWLLEILLGDVTGAVTPVQVEQLVHGLESVFILLFEDEYQLNPVYYDRVDPGLPYKYEVTRFSLDLIDLYLIESGTALNFNLHPVRLSICNSHTKDYAKALSACIGEFFLKFFINEASRLETENSNKERTSSFKKPYSRNISLMDSVSNLSQKLSSSTSSLSSISISSLNSSSIYTKLDKSSSQQTLVIDTNNKENHSNISLKSNLNSPAKKIPDSNEFNYWFECSCLSSGKITIDLAYEEGKPEEQIEFLRLHDEKTKRLFFLWDDYKIDFPNVCGCVGGCNYYSVFDYTGRLNELKSDCFDFFNLQKSIARTNPDFGRSLFYPNCHVLESQPIMYKIYPIETYDYNECLETNEIEKCRVNPSGIGGPIQETLDIKKSNLSLNKLEKRPSTNRLSVSLSTLSSRRLSKNLNQDDYYTADEEDEDDTSTIKRPKLKKIPRNSIKSLHSSKSSKSKQTYFSTAQLDSTQTSENLETIISEATNNTFKLNLDDKQDKKYSLFYDEEPKMDLNFDIKRPILDSSLPKYCYLKYLSRAYVQNWNKTCSYPYYEDFSRDNIFFCYRKQGIDLTNLVSTDYQTRPHWKVDSTQSDDPQSDADIKRRINLKFKTFECYVTPLALTGVTRFTDSLKLYQVNPNSMLTSLQAKTYTHSIKNSIIQAISKTQVSLKIPQIRLFSLQCGLAEGDKVSNAFVSTLTNPDEFITLSLFTVCIYSIETQLIASEKNDSAIFMIDKIDTQFCRLYDSENLKKILNSSEQLSELNPMEKVIKLSSISNENSKTSIRYCKGDTHLQCLIMQECAFDRISIKAIKRTNSNSESTINNQISISELDISNIWFSFPEPPASPKGKRKIPFSRFDWNLLSSVSPAVISWLCASKDCIKSIKDLFTSRIKSTNENLALLLNGASKNRTFLESVLECKIYNLKNSKIEPISTRSKSSKMPKQTNNFDPKNFLKVYLSKSSYYINQDPNCRMVNILRNYLLYFSDELNADLNIKEGEFKKMINDILLSWTSELVGENGLYPIETSHHVNTVVNFNEKNDFKCETVLDSSQKLTSSDESVENLNEKSSDESLVIKLGNRTHIQNINDKYKPILSYIGIDAPSVTLMDNLFKNFGSLLFANLNIKSVHINILGSFGVKSGLLKTDPELGNCFKLKNYTGKNIDPDQKIITTILSFDDLVFNLNVRQVIPESQKIQNEPLKVNDKGLSMNNPLYLSNEKPVDPKYYTKIDAGIKVNNVTQEVNMPLLRLAHQIYSIIADAIDLEKENHRINSSINLKEDPNRSLQKILEHKASFRQAHHNHKQINLKKEYFAFKDKSHVSIFGWFTIRNINFKAGVGNLALNGEMKNFQSTVLMGRKMIGTSSKLQYDGSLNIRMDSAFGKLTENDKKINVVLLNIRKSHLFGYLSTKNIFSSFIHIGMINIDVPIQPILVHGVVIRESKVIEQKILPEIKNFAIFENVDENLKEEKQASNQDKSKNRQGDVKPSTSYSQFNEKPEKHDTTDKNIQPPQSQNTLTFENETLSYKNRKPLSRKNKHQMSMNAEQKKNFFSKFRLNFKSKFDGLEIRAKLLETPCLKAAYLIENVECTISLSHERSNFGCILNKHSLSFQCDDEVNDEDLRSTFMTMKPLEERTNFFLPSITLNGNHLSRFLIYENQQDNPKISKSFNLSEVKFRVRISKLTRELNAEVIAQLVFVIKVFLKEINNILQAVYGAEDTSDQISIENTPRSIKSTPTNFSFQSQSQNPVINYFFYDFRIEMGQISLTGITPSNTALTVYTSDQSSLVLNNLKSVDGIEGLKIADLMKNFDFTLKPSVEAKAQLSVELKKAFTDCAETDDWYQLAYFDTKFDLKNERKKASNTNLERESIIITVEKPRFYFQPGAIDCAILFWLNYKSTYEFWLQQRQQFSNQIEKDFLKSTASPISFPTSSDKTNVGNFLTLKLRVTGLGLALPLSGKMFKKFLTSSTDCLVISLHETAIYACSSGCIVSKGQFNNFSLRFIENFNLSNSEWAPVLPHSETKIHPSVYQKTLMNSWIVPSGYYEVCSSTIDKPKILTIPKNDPKNLLKNTPIWILSVKWKMEGIEINMDTNIGKWLSKLGDTVTRLAETQNIKETSSDDQDAEIRRLKQELLECMERGETSKANAVQSKIDLISLASYPERAKQIFVKRFRRGSSIIQDFNTKNNLIKGQLGFNLNQLQTPSTPIKNPNENRSLIESDTVQDKTPVFRQTQPTYRRHSRAKSEPLYEAILSLFKSLSNDDLNFTSNPKLRFMNSPTLIEENENETLSSSFSENRKSQIVTQAPSIDFKLDVKIEISSGKCVLHANKPSQQQNRMNYNYSSPVASGYYNQDFMRGFVGNGNLSPNISANYSEPDTRNTNFIFPGVRVQTFYESTHKKIDDRMIKKANIYAMIKIESFAFPTTMHGFNNMRDLYGSKDMIISPVLLDFIEQTLEPFDLKPLAPTPETAKQKFYKSDSTDDELGKKKSMTVQENKEPSYFPVDVVVFVSMKPSAIRFTCLPQSTMECLLKLPSVETVFSTSRMDFQNQSKLENILKNELSNEDLISNSMPTTSNEGGLNLTCSLSDFSLKFYNRLAIRNPLNESRFFYNDSQIGVEEKDSLSVRVAYIKVNISRNKRALSRMLPNFDSTASSLNEVKLSILADVGSTSFIYDMRNIKEVFVFPKIWYRRSFARRIIFGDDLTSNTNIRSTNENFKTKSEPKKESKFIPRPKSLDLDVDQNSYATNPNWKTLVLISVNLAELEVRMNIGSVLGNVILLTKNGRLTSKISLSRYGPRDMEYNFSLDNTQLVAQGSPNLIYFRIQDINALIKMNEKDKKTNLPLNKIELGIFAAECRFDSGQSNPILALRFSNFGIKLSDSWFNLDDADKLPEALVDLNVSWDQLHLMMTRSTTAEITILYHNLISYFSKQFMESKDYIKECELDLFYEMKVKQQFIEKKELYVSKRFNVNGGNINLKGNNFTLITFHGNSFKAIKWAVFSLNEPSMDFASQSHFENGKLKNQQNLMFYMGRNKRKKDMASIYMVYRDSASIFTKLQTISEWFDYAHSSIDAVGLRDFPRFATDEHPMLMTQTLKKKTTDQTKLEEIFHLPSLQIFCDTTIEENKVKFEFKTEFHDHIQLTFRTELFGFLHELITSYMKETDLIISREPNIPKSVKDEREYECVRWELEPTLRLISKFGSSVEPLGVDGLLKSLGFHHARSTIPKWLQRGLLDNLDEATQGLIKVYLKILSDFNPSRIQRFEHVD